MSGSAWTLREIPQSFSDGEVIYLPRHASPWLVFQAGRSDFAFGKIMVEPHHVSLGLLGTTAEI